MSRIYNKLILKSPKSKILINNVNELIISETENSEIVVLGNVNKIKINKQSKNNKLIIFGNVETLEVDKNSTSNFFFINNLKKGEIESDDNKLIIKNVKDLKINSNNNELFLVNNIFIHRNLFGILLFNFKEYLFLYKMRNVSKKTEISDHLRNLIYRLNSLYIIYFQPIYVILKEITKKFENEDFEDVYLYRFLNIDYNKLKRNFEIENIKKELKNMYYNIKFEDREIIKIIEIIEEYIDQITSELYHMLNDFIRNIKYITSSNKQIKLEIGGSNNTIFSIYPINTEKITENNKIISIKSINTKKKIIVNS